MLGRSIKLLAVGSVLTAALAIADPQTEPPQSPSSSSLDTITVEATRDRKVLEQRVDKFIYGITVTSFGDSIAQWQKTTPICPLVAGLSGDEGEGMLARVSQIAADAGVSLAPEICQPNFYVIVSSVPEEVLSALSKHNKSMFGNGYPTKIRRFMKDSTPVRVWYNFRFTDRDGTSCAGSGVSPGVLLPINGLPVCPDEAHMAYGGVRDIFSVIVVVDARQTKGISFGQLAAYVAMNGLIEIRPHPKVGDALSILNLFTDANSAPPLGLSQWDAAYLKAIYHTEQNNKTQMLAVKDAVVNDLAPRPH